jgi:hypothetical protein
MMAPQPTPQYGQTVVLSPTFFFRGVSFEEARALSPSRRPKSRRPPVVTPDSFKKSLRFSSTLFPPFYKLA